MALQYGSGGNVQVKMGGPYGSVSGSGNKITTINVPAANWKGATSPYSQVVAVDGITVSSKVDVQLTEAQIIKFQNYAFQAINSNGVVTLYAHGGVPDADMEIQATISETIGGGVILGDVATTTKPQSDYNQDNPDSPDFIKNKPTEEIRRAQSTADDALARTGGTMTGAVDMGSNQITNLKAPTSGTDAANKNYVDTRKKTAVCVLPQTGWQNNSQTVAADGVTSTNTVIVAPAADSFSNYRNFGVRCTAQGEGSLTFAYEFTPTADLNVNVLILE